MHPSGLNGIQPRALPRQQPGQLRLLTWLLGRPVVGPDPLPQTSALMPSGIVPQQDDYLLQFFSRQGQEGDDEQLHQFAIGLPVSKIQHRFLGILAHGPETG